MEHLWYAACIQSQSTSSNYFMHLFLICSHIPPVGASMNDFGSNTRGIGVFLLTLNRYLDRRETSPTLVCINPNRIPETKDSLWSVSQTIYTNLCNFQCALQFINVIKYHPSHTNWRKLQSLDFFKVSARCLKDLWIWHIFNKIIKRVPCSGMLRRVALVYFFTLCVGC
jgi:hypothetical protein